MNAVRDRSLGRAARAAACVAQLTMSNCVVQYASGSDGDLCQ